MLQDHDDARNERIPLFDASRNMITGRPLFSKRDDEWDEWIFYDIGLGFSATNHVRHGISMTFDYAYSDERNSWPHGLHTSLT
jgi:hypothetical protein